MTDSGLIFIVLRKGLWVVVGPHTNTESNGISRETFLAFMLLRFLSFIGAIFIERLKIFVYQKVIKDSDSDWVSGS